MDENAVKRFIYELRYARRISHENVIRIYDFLTLGRSYAISMEYFPSHSLADELQDGVPLHPKRGLKIVWDICRGIGSAHQLGIVHRDLKPPNILLNDHNLVKVVDFGLAAASQVESRLTKTGVLLGTPTYMAPEQVRNRAIDVRTDIYSLGIIMYEMFTGHPPYTADDPMSVLFQHIEGKPTPPREIQPDLPSAIEGIILKAMEVEPANRFQTMDDLRKGIVALSKNCMRE
jgi:serine/threonine-protein kinase